jgi:hypothetical protein
MEALMTVLISRNFDDCPSDEMIVVGGPVFLKWYATFITDTKATPIESRLLVVATCFDISGSIARVSGITSSKSAFRVFENS